MQEKTMDSVLKSIWIHTSEWESFVMIPHNNGRTHWGLSTKIDLYNSERAMENIRGWMQLCCHRNKTQHVKAWCQEQMYQLWNGETLSLKWKAFCLPYKSCKTTCGELIPADMRKGELKQEVLKWKGEGDSGKELRLPNVCVYSCVCFQQCSMPSSLEDCSFSCVCVLLWMWGW